MPRRWRLLPLRAAGAAGQRCQRLGGHLPDAGGAGGGPQRADTLTGTFIVNTKRWPSLLTFFHWDGCPSKGKGPGNLKRSLGVSA